MLLTRISALGAHTGSWTLPAVGSTTRAAAAALAREVREECGVDCEVGALIGVHDLHFSGTHPAAGWRTIHAST